MARSPIPTLSYVLVVCRHEGRFLLVEERKHGGGFYLPAGGLELGETIVEAAVRETLEEAGVLVEPTSLLAMDHVWLPNGGRVTQKLRFVLEARVTGDPTPKSHADKHSVGARWVAPEEIRDLPLRHPEVCAWTSRVTANRPVLPLHSYMGESLYRASRDLD